MKKNIFKETLLAAALAGGMIYAVAAPSEVTGAGANRADSNVNNVQLTAAQAQVSRIAQQQLEQWVKGFETAMPYYRVQLKSFETQGDQSIALIEFSMGSPGMTSMLSGSSFYSNFETRVTIEHGLAFENGKASVARFNSTTRLKEDSSEDLVALIGDKLFDRTWGIVTPLGELETRSESAEPLKLEMDGVAFDVPSYTGVFSTYKQAQLSHMEITVPSAAFYGLGYRSDSGVWLTNIRLVANDKPIRDALFDLNGHTEITIEKTELRADEETFFTMSGLKYVEDAQVDDKGLYQGTYAVSAEGAVKVSERLNRESRPLDQFSFNMAGTLSNLPAKSYTELMRLVYGDKGDLDEERLQTVILDLLSNEPKYDIQKMTVVFNGGQGDATFSMSMLPLSQKDREMDLYLMLMQKLQVNATMDIPVQWLKVALSEDEVEAFLEGVVGEGYISRTGDRLTSSFVYDRGNMTINGKPLRGGRGGMPF